MDNYPHTSTKMCTEYLELFNSLVENNTLDSNKSLTVGFQLKELFIDLSEI